MSLLGPGGFLDRHAVSEYPLRACSVATWCPCHRQEARCVAGEYLEAQIKFDLSASSPNKTLTAIAAKDNTQNEGIQSLSKNFKTLPEG